MASAATSPPSSNNPLISHQSSELQAVLHPLVLLSISDYITRHTLQGCDGPIIGGLMGQHNGREISIEHAFECHIVAAPDTPYRYKLDLDKVQKRIEQLRTVLKDRNLDFIGWYTLFPRSGPGRELTHIHNTILTEINESAILLGFHPNEIDQSAGGKLPVTMYESIYEVDGPAKSDDAEGDEKMRDGEAEPTSQSGPLKLKYREIAHAVETGEAEMISMDFVAQSSGVATAVEPVKEKEQPAARKPGASTSAAGKAASRILKGKQKAGPADFVGPAAATATTTPQEETATLSNEEEEMIAALVAKANAIKMLQSRIQLIITYLDSLPPDFVSGKDPTATATNQGQLPPSHKILRQINALVGRLDLIEPSDLDAFRKELLREENDTKLLSLLNDVLHSVKEIRDVGRVFEIVAGQQRARELDAKASWDMTANKGLQSAAGDIML